MSKKAQLPRCREPEEPQLHEGMDERQRVIAETEGHIYNANVILSSIARHAETLNKATQLEEVVGLVKVVRAVQSRLQ